LTESSTQKSSTLCVRVNGDLAECIRAWRARTACRFSRSKSKGETVNAWSRIIGMQLGGGHECSIFDDHLLAGISIGAIAFQGLHAQGAKQKAYAASEIEALYATAALTVSPGLQGRELIWR
jgi:hypothetical protein